MRCQTVHVLDMEKYMLSSTNSSQKKTLYSLQTHIIIKMKEWQREAHAEFYSSFGLSAKLTNVQDTGYFNQDSKLPGQDKQLQLSACVATSEFSELPTSKSCLWLLSTYTQHSTLTLTWEESSVTNFFYCFQFLFCSFFFYLLFLKYSVVFIL